ncbi:hypothetical protein GZH46_01663 [Fragariocoptes setiger]|uniref:Uncharacterized protein n=1 Tax=Fragariocoptes setiger TaxID=1670756 RepID=A0ABQ7S8Q4_9ACAR|nr:hypothetical protein GZH46_01663 [Fragariocoptes setiger]
MANPNDEKGKAPEFVAIMLKRESQEPITSRHRLAKWVSRISKGFVKKLSTDSQKYSRFATRLHLGNVDRAGRALKEYFLIALPNDLACWNDASPSDVEEAILKVIAPIPVDHVWYELRLYASSFLTLTSDSESESQDSDKDPYMPALRPEKEHIEFGKDEIDEMLPSLDSPRNETTAEHIMSVDEIEQSLLNPADTSSRDGESSSSESEAEKETTQPEPTNFIEKRVPAPQTPPENRANNQGHKRADDDSDSDIEIIGSFPGWLEPGRSRSHGRA